MPQREAVRRTAATVYDWLREHGHEPQGRPEDWQSTGGPPITFDLHTIERGEPRAVAVVFDGDGVRVRSPEGTTLPGTGPIPWNDERLTARLWDCLSPYLPDLPRL